MNSLRLAPLVVPGVVWQGFRNRSRPRHFDCW